MAILIGLYFVYAEIRQNGVIARAEMSSQSQMRIEYINAQFSESTFRAIYIKGVRSPSDLNESERLRLHTFFDDVAAILLYEHNTYRLGIFKEYEFFTRILANRYFRQGFGRAWWNVQKVRFGPEIGDVVDNELMKMDPTYDWIRIDEELQNEVESL